MMNSNDKLCNWGFITLNVFVLFAFGNLAVFFSFYSYLKTLPIPTELNGVIIGAFAVSALIVRPFISTIFNRNNAVKWIVIGLSMTIVSLLLYPFAQSTIPMILLRIIHGTSYVTLVTASIVLMMYVIPPNKSGQAFGIITVSSLLPYAIIPFVLDNYFIATPQNVIYVATAFLMMPSVLLLIPLAKYFKAQETIGDEKSTQNKLPRGSLLYNLKQPRIVCILLANGLMFSVFSLIFFFLKTFFTKSDMGNPGFFFTISTISMILVRLIFGALFDKYNKAFLILISFLIFASSLILLGLANSKTLFYVAAVLYGVGLGAAAPLMNGLMYTVSLPEHRGLNTNLMLEMIDLGFFIGPAAGGLALAAKFTMLNILSFCIGTVALAIIFIVPLIKSPKNI